MQLELSDEDEDAITVEIMTDAQQLWRCFARTIFTGR
uniref:Uncharacterized protein n=1 Tax=Anguilla anguilla TaxID=7936 RepID=A0A0E9UTZ0_ANGAN